MPIPTQADRDIAEIQNTANLVVGALNILRRSDKHTTQYELDRRRRRVRETLREFADAVVDMANQW